MSQEEKLEELLGENSEKPENNPDLDSWMDPEDWEQIQLDQIKLMLSDDSKPDFDLDAAIGFDRSELASEVDQILAGEEIPEFATRRSRQVEDILRKNRPVPEPAPAREDRPIAPEFEAETPESAPEIKKHWWKKQPAPAAPEPDPQPMSRETVSLHEALDRVHADDEVKEQLVPPGEETIEDILKGIDLGPDNGKSPAALRWEAEMPALTCPEVPLSRKEKKAAARKQAERQAEEQAALRKKEAQAAKDEKQARRAEKREARKNSLTGVVTVIVAELAGIAGILGWWYQWMH